jgi:DNA-binding IclR family transcriptional regulator
VVSAIGYPTRLMAEAPIRVIARAVKILDCYLDARGSLGISEISRKTALSKATVHHVVTTLVETGLLATDGPSRRYRLGPKLAQLGSAFVESTDLRELALPLMTELRDLTLETVTLHVRVADERVIIAQVESTQSIRRVLELGASRPMWLGAAGVVLMTGISDEEVGRLLKRSRPRRLTPKTVIEKAQIMALIQRARADGYCTLGEQTHEGVCGIALPIHDHRGVVQAAILISGPLQRWNPRTIAPLLKRIVGTVEGASRQLGRRLESPVRAPTVATRR